jgi:hypothetical protein
MEEVGVYRELYDNMGFRGCTYRVYVTETNSVLIQEREWSTVAGESDRTSAKEFDSLDAAVNTPEYTRVIANMYITEKGRNVEIWREAWANL